MFGLQTSFDEDLQHELAELVEISADGFRRRVLDRAGCPGALPERIASTNFRQEEP